MKLPVRAVLLSLMVAILAVGVLALPPGEEAEAQVAGDSVGLFIAGRGQATFVDTSGNIVLELTGLTPAGVAFPAPALFDGEFLYYTTDTTVVRTPFDSSASTVIYSGVSGNITIRNIRLVGETIYVLATGTDGGVFSVNKAGGARVNLIPGSEVGNSLGGPSFYVTPDYIFYPGVRSGTFNGMRADITGQNKINLYTVPNVDDGLNAAVFADDIYTYLIVRGSPALFFRGTHASGSLINTSSVSLPGAQSFRATLINGVPYILANPGGLQELTLNENGAVTAVNTLLPGAGLFHIESVILPAGIGSVTTSMPTPETFLLRVATYSTADDTPVYVRYGLTTTPDTEPEAYNRLALPQRVYNNVATFMLTDLSPLRQYAVQASLNADYSDPEVHYFTVPAPPSAPENLTARQTALNEVLLQWDDPMDTNIIDYRYRYRTFGVSSGDWSDWEVLPKSGATTTNRYIGPGVFTPRVTYQIEVHARNVFGQSEASEVTLHLTGPPLQTEGLTAEAGDEEVQLAWINVGIDASISTWLVLVCPDGVCPDRASPIVGSSALTAQFLVTGLDNDVAYDFYIQSLNADGLSPLSSVATATPTAPPSVPDAPAGLRADSLNLGQ